MEVETRILNNFANIEPHSPARARPCLLSQFAMIAPITKHLIFLASLVTVTWTILNLVLVYIDRDAAVATNPLGLVVHALVWLLGLVVTNVGFLLFRKLQLREESAIKRLVASEQRKAEEELVAVRQGAEQGLRESEARYRFVTENMSDVLWLLDAKTLRFEYISPSVERLLGFTVEEAMQQSPFEALTAEYHHLIGDDYRKRIHAFEAGDQTMKVKTHRINQPRKGGDTVPVELVTTLILGPDGLVQYVQGISRDITERLELEKGLHQRENDYGVFISATMDGVLETNLQGTILTTNDAYCKMLGFKKEELVGQHMSSLEGNENEGEVRRHAELIRATGSDRFETRHRRKDGSLIDVVLQVTHVSTRNVLVAFVHDISELKQQNLALKESEERARRVIENAGAGYFQLDREGHFVEVNGAWLTMHGFVSAGEVLGTHFIHTQVAVDVAYEQLVNAPS